MTRDEKGRFKKGVSGNPGGRSRNEAATTLRDALATALTPEKATAIAEKMIAQAERGDRQAREQLLRFLGLFDDRLSFDGMITVADLDTVMRRVYGSNHD